MTDNDRTRAGISAILSEIEALHRGSGEPADALDVYEARQAVLRIENALRRAPPAQEGAQ